MGVLISRTLTVLLEILAGHFNANWVQEKLSFVEKKNKKHTHTLWNYMFLKTQVTMKNKYIKNLHAVILFHEDKHSPLSFAIMNNPVWSWNIDIKAINHQNRFPF